MQQATVLTEQFGMGAYHGMAIEGCALCVAVLGEAMFRASHEYVTPMMTHFQRGLLAHGTAITTENTVAKRTPFTLATAYWYTDFGKDEVHFQCVCVCVHANVRVRVCARAHVCVCVFVSARASGSGGGGAAAAAVGVIVVVIVVVVVAVVVVAVVVVVVVVVVVSLF